MKFILLIYNDAELLDALPEGEADSMMRELLRPRGRSPAGAGV